MSNRVIKISIILIFMLFVTGLFNFCFAFSIDTDKELVTTITSYNSSGTTMSVPIYKFKISYIECPTEHTYKLYLYSGVYNQMRCYVSNNPLVFDCSQNDWRIYLKELDENGNLISTTNTDRYIYNFNTNTWSYKDSGSSVDYVNNNLNSTYLFCDYTQPVLYGLESVEDTEITQIYPEAGPSIDIEINQTGSRTGHVTFIPKNYDGSMYYIKGDKDTLNSLVANGNISKNDSNVNYYSGPIYIEENEYVLGLIFDDDGNVIFSKISETIEYDPDFIFNDSHCLRLEQDDMDTYYLFIHSPQERRLYKSI